MTSKYLLLRMLPMAAALAVAMPAPAQIVGSQAGLTLSQYLMLLAQDPRDETALIGAGQAALDLGDTEAAMGFFTRAEAVDARNGRAKMGIAEVWLAMEKPADAIRLFDAAVKLGVPEADIARDRGLAYDLRGDPRRAQRDYAIAVRRGGDDEAIRRYALSLGISGDRDKALAMLDPLLLKQDRAAWRARAFVLAMSGDVDGARGIAAAVMPTVAAPMTPFFARLGGLSPAQRAAAVHFGHIPNDGRTDGRLYASPGGDGRVLTAEGPLVPAGDPVAVRPGDLPARTAMAPVSKDPRRRPGKALEAADRPRTVELARAAPATSTPPKKYTPPGTVAFVLADLPPIARAQLEKPPNPVLDSVIARTQAANPPQPTLPTAAPSPGIASPEPKVAAEPGFTAVQPSEFTLPAGAPAPGKPAAAPVVTAVPRRNEAGNGLVGIVDGLKVEPTARIAPKPETVSPPPVARLAAKPKPEPAKPATIKPATIKPADKLAEKVKPADKAKVVEPAKPATVKPADKKLADKKAAEKKVADKKLADKKLADKKAAAAQKAQPARVWAQIATGANPVALVKDYDKLARKSPAAFKGQTGWSVPFKGTRRLLVGPFASQQKAMDFLKRAGITGIPFESPAGMEIAKLPAK